MKTDYTIYDKVSSLPVHALDDGFIREMAQRGNKSCEEILEITLYELKKVGIEYFVSHDKKEIITKAKGSFFKCQGEYFDDYKEAKKYLKSLKKKKYIFTLVLLEDNGYDGGIEKTLLVSSKDNNKLKRIESFLLYSIENDLKYSSKIEKYLNEPLFSSLKIGNSKNSFSIIRTKII